MSLTLYDLSADAWSRLTIWPGPSVPGAEGLGFEYRAYHKVKQSDSLFDEAHPVGSQRRCLVAADNLARPERPRAENLGFRV